MRVTETETTTYRPMFSREDIPMRTARVDHEGTVIHFSQREDDPEGVWCADFAMGPGGEVLFSHGTGDRTCIKQTASPDVANMLDSAFA